jgi:hypothetical protein
VGFLKRSPTFGQHASQNTLLQVGHCQAFGFMKLPISLPHFPQNPLTKVLILHIEKICNLKR